MVVFLLRQRGVEGLNDIVEGLGVCARVECAGVGSLPVSEALAQRVLSLPMHPYMPEDTAERICRAVIKAVSGQRYKT